MVQMTSIGVADGIAQQINAVIALENGVSGVFDMAIYAGNVPSDPADQENLPPENLNYILDFGGENDDSDVVTGDVYSGGDVNVFDDAQVSPAVEEPFTDTNGNGVYDRGEFLSVDIDMDGEFDPDLSESFVDANGNDVYDMGEDFNDMNGNGQYDANEDYIDSDLDGVFDPSEPFVDVNGNGRQDSGIEAVGDVRYPKVPEAAGGDNVLLPPDIFDMDYENTAEVNVGERFADAGIDSGIMPESDPSHIFLRNPRDGREDIVDDVFDLNGQKINPDDYFLEDPYEGINVGAKDDAENASRISLSGGPAGKEEDGNQIVYFIDGNLWLNSRDGFSYKIQDAENKGCNVLFVVRGNIIMADNFYYRNINKDQIAFLAMTREDDPKGEISGNIYIGDEDHGTLSHLEGLFYAENNFYDNNLDEDRSEHFDIYGCLLAGNQVRINRDYTIPGHYELRRVKRKWVDVWVEEEKRHSAMEVIFDERYVDGPNGKQRLVPGLPLGPRQDGAMTIRVASTVHIGRADVPQEYYELYGENNIARYDYDY
jgi:hypothetical protein